MFVKSVIHIVMVLLGGEVLHSYERGSILNANSNFVLANQYC